MVDYHQQPDAVHRADSSSNNSSCLFQSRLDTFMMQEKVNVDQSGGEGASDDLQLRLDGLLNDLNQNIDTALNDTEKVERPTSYRRLIAAVLIGACATIIAIAWLVQPVTQDLLPQLPTQQPHPDAVAPRAVAKVDRTPPSALITAHNAAVVVAATAKAAPKQVGVKAAHATVQLKVAVRLGNIRNAPDRAAKILHRLLKGTTVTKLAERGEWFKVRLRNGSVAWAHRSIF